MQQILTRASARGDRRVARGILIRVQDVAELAMTVAADTIHTAFFLGAFFLGSTCLTVGYQSISLNTLLSIYWNAKGMFGGGIFTSN
jgi:hypothetical protein